MSDYRAPSDALTSAGLARFADWLKDNENSHGFTSVEDTYLGGFREGVLWVADLISTMAQPREASPSCTSPCCNRDVPS